MYLLFCRFISYHSIIIYSSSEKALSPECSLLSLFFFLACNETKRKTWLCGVNKNKPGQIVPLFGHLFEQDLHCSDTVMVFFRPQQVLLPLALQLVGLMTELKPGIAQAIELSVFL